MTTSQKIIDYVKKYGQVTPDELIDYLDIGARAIQKQLRKLTDTSVLAKSGRPPRVYYSIAPPSTEIERNGIKNTQPLDAATAKVINDNFLYISPTGIYAEGLQGFVRWSKERNLDIVKTAKIYLQTLRKYEKYRDRSGLIGGMSKMRSTFKNVALDQVFYIDFYAIEVFGKTKLGQMLLYAKQSQNRTLINQLADTIKPAIENVIARYKIDCVGFIPPTIKRELQLMRQIEKRLNLNTKTLPLVKVKMPISVPQKTLTKLEDRVVNARETIVIEGRAKYNNILLIDDAVGSGSTLNETAKKIRRKEICDGNIIGIAITGSFKGFDVISEV